MKQEKVTDHKRGAFIDQLRREKGMTLDELGAIVSRDRSSVHRYISGDPVPLGILVKLTEIFHVTEGELLRGARDNKPATTPVIKETTNNPNIAAMDTNKQQRYYELLEENYILKKENEELRKELTGKKEPGRETGS